MNYPIGIQSFRKIREEGYLYIDKTAYIPALLQNGQYKFLSRPRRFGKSLLISTLEAFFRGERELFEGLAIDKLMPEEWIKHPVIHLDFSGENYSSTEVLESKLDAFLKRFEAELNLEADNNSFSERFRTIVRTLHERTGHQVVILIDEYDNPITSSIGRRDLQEKFQAILYGFYSSLKSLDSHLKFCMLTGVTKYGHLSVFSGLNNLQDISFLDDFAGICGISEVELRHNLQEGVKRFGLAEGVDVEAAFRTLKEWYDGYHFSRMMVDIYNPYSLINALASNDISDYWHRTGIPTILIRLLKEQTYDIASLNDANATIDMLDSISVLNKINPLALFYQTGYLTIKSYDPATRFYTLGYPNKEVECGLMGSILNDFGHINDSKIFVSRLRTYLENGEIQEFLDALTTFFARIPYDLHKNVAKYENYYHTIFYVLLRLIGMDANAEYHTSEGSIDILITTCKFIYIIELKINGTADDAMCQIEEKDYAAQFAIDNRKLIKVGIGFAERTHIIDTVQIKS